MSTDRPDDAHRHIRILTATVSDTRRGDDDRSGAALRSELIAAGFVHVGHEQLADDQTAIAALVSRVTRDDEADVLVLTGGTGLAPRDVTPETLEALFHKRLDGFGEAFRQRSWEAIGPRAMLSRATAGTISGRLVFCLPGSPHAARLGVELLLPILRHGVELATGEASRHP
jgi:molybdenum cofactor biosynthesis protein B